MVYAALTINGEAYESHDSEDWPDHTNASFANTWSRWQSWAYKRGSRRHPFDFLQGSYRMYADS